MKELIKWLLRAAASLFGIGALLAAVGWALGGQTSMVVPVGERDVSVGLGGIHAFGSVRPGARHELTSDDLVPFTQLEIDIALGEINLRPSDHYGIVLEWSGEPYELHYTNEGGTLRVWSSSTPVMGLGFRLEHRAKATIYLPEGTHLNQLMVKTALGSVELDGFSADNFELRADLGDVDISNAILGRATANLSLGSLDLKQVSADHLDLTLSMGDLKADDLSTKELIAVNHMGKIKLEGRFEGQTKLVSSMGDVEVSTDLPQRDYGYDLNVSMGKITVDGEHQESKLVQPGGTHNIAIENSMGDITLQFQ